MVQDQLLLQKTLVEEKAQKMRLLRQLQETENEKLMLEKVITQQKIENTL